MRLMNDTRINCERIVYLFKGAQYAYSNLSASFNVRGQMDGAAVS